MGITFTVIFNVWSIKGDFSFNAFAQVSGLTFYSINEVARWVNNERFIPGKFAFLSFFLPYFSNLIQNKQRRNSQRKNPFNFPETNPPDSKKKYNEINS
jgi:hypothetical protein